MRYIPTKITVEECDLVEIKWVDAYDALGSGWFDWKEIYSKAQLAKCTSVGYEIFSDKHKIVLMADNCEEYGGRITVIPSSWQLTKDILRKGKKKKSLMGS